MKKKLVLYRDYVEYSRYIGIIDDIMISFDNVIRLNSIEINNIPTYKLLLFMQDYPNHCHILLRYEIELSETICNISEKYKDIKSIHASAIKRIKHGKYFKHTTYCIQI